MNKLLYISSICSTFLYKCDFPIPLVYLHEHLLVIHFATIGPVPAPLNRYMAVSVSAGVSVCPFVLPLVTLYL